MSSRPLWTANPLTNTLYGADTTTDQVITINTSTGVATAVGPLGFVGLGFDEVTGTLYGTDSGFLDSGQMITIDTATGAGTAVGPTLFGVFGLAGRLP